MSALEKIKSIEKCPNKEKLEIEVYTKQYNNLMESLAAEFMKVYISNEEIDKKKKEDSPASTSPSTAEKAKFCIIKIENEESPHIINHAITDFRKMLDEKRYKSLITDNVQNQKFGPFKYNDITTNLIIRMY